MTFPQGIVKVGAVDADQHKSLGGQYGVRGFPTIKIFGANKNKPEEYQGTELCCYNFPMCKLKVFFHSKIFQVLLNKLSKLIS